MLVEHRIDDVNECLVTVEQAVAPGEEVPLEPSFALVLGQHRVEHASLRGEELIAVDDSSVPLPVGHLEDGAEKIGDRLVGTEYPKMAMAHVQRDDVA